MYVIDPDRLQDLRSRLEPVHREGGGWTSLLRDHSSGQQWILQYHNSQMHGGGIPFLRTDPPPQDLSDWLNTCLQAGTDEDAKGLAWELSTHFEEWPDVLTWIGDHVNRIKPDVLELFLDELGIFHVINRRPVLGKSSAAIQDDYAHFKALASRARGLIGDA